MSVLAFPLWVAAIVAIVGLPVVGLGLRAYSRPELLEGPTVFGASLIAVVVGLALVIYAEASDAPTLLGGGIVGLTGIGVLTGAIAALPESEGTGSEH